MNGRQKASILAASAPTTITAHNQHPLNASAPSLKIPDEDEIEKINFYSNYDVMTGVRIAATLGGFFGLMVILVLYKSKSKTEKALEDPNLAAQAVAEAEEEERQIVAALEATAYEQLNPNRRTRRSLDTASSTPHGWTRSATRFSSIGGYSSLLEPPTRTHSRLPMPCSIDEDSPPEDRSLYDDISTYYNRYLDVPRRPSNITCSSSGSSYLERRNSAVILGLPALPGHKARGKRRQSSPLPEIYDFYYPIDIRVIQPTPGGSPCGSERALYDVPAVNLTPRLAPLASISSCNTSLAVDYPDLEANSFASDSVFHDDECEDTDEEIDPFSTDSDISDSDRGACCRTVSFQQDYSRSSKETLTPISERPPCPLPSPTDASSTHSLTLVGELNEKDSSSSIPLADSACKSSTNLGSSGKWSEETLF